MELIMNAQRENTFTKWIVGVVGTSIIALLGWLAVRDHTRIDTTLDSLALQDKALGIILERSQIDLAVAKTREETLSDDIKELKDGQKEMNAKLDRVLAEVRKR